MREPASDRVVRIDCPERGAGLGEYGILLLLILVVCLVAMGTLGTTISALYDTITSQF